MELDTYLEPVLKVPHLLLLVVVVSSRCFFFLPYVCFHSLARVRVFVLIS